MADTKILDHETTGVTCTAVGSVVSVSLSSAATELLEAGDYKFDVLIYYSATSKMTVGNGIVSVSENQSRG